MVTPAFRAWSGTPIYFELDGHPNAAGHRLYAQQLAPAVAATLRALPPPCRS
jgi:lysophospholipase L1-like esterase